MADQKPGTIDSYAEEDVPDAGKRASFDTKTGVVKGSGIGNGGGQEGEDFDDDPATGSGYPTTGSDIPKVEKK